MEKGKHQGTRPEMGTPEYEEWRKRMLARRRKRLQRERRKRLIAMGVALVLVIGGVSQESTAVRGKKTLYPVRIKFLPMRKRIPQKIRQHQTEVLQIPKHQIPQEVQQQRRIYLCRQISWHSSITMMKQLNF